MAAEIYIFRHGIETTLPEPPGLSARGLARVRRQARGLVWMGVSLDVILSSTDIVSRETATALAQAFAPVPAVIDTPALGPDGNVEAALQAVSDEQAIRVAAVGCEPIVGLLAAQLIGAPHPLMFKKAGACRIDVEEGNPCGRLRWFLPPKVLREMGRWA